MTTFDVDGSVSKILQVSTDRLHSLLIPAPLFNGLSSLPAIYCLECLKFLFMVRLLYKLGDADRRLTRQGRLLSPRLRRAGGCLSSVMQNSPPAVTEKSPPLLLRRERECQPRDSWRDGPSDRRSSHARRCQWSVGSDGKSCAVWRWTGGWGSRNWPGNSDWIGRPSGGACGSPRGGHTSVRRGRGRCWLRTPPTCGTAPPRSGTPPRSCFKNSVSTVTRGVTRRSSSSSVPSAQPSGAAS